MEWDFQYIFWGGIYSKKSHLFLFFLNKKLFFGIWLSGANEILFPCNGYDFHVLACSNGNLGNAVQWKVKKQDTVKWYFPLFQLRNPSRDRDSFIQLKWNIVFSFLIHCLRKDVFITEGTQCRLTRIEPESKD